MKKKLMGVLLAVTLLASQAMAVFAAGSTDASTAVTSETDGITVSAYDSTGVEASAATAIAEVNSTGTLSALASIGELKDAVKGATLVSGKFFDVSGITPNNDGKYTFSLRGLALSGMDKGSVRVIHYSTVRNVWEVVKPDSVDRSEGKLTVTLKDLSPVAVIAEKASSSDDDSSSDSDDAVVTTAAAPAPADASGVATSPKTGVVSDWALWMGAAVVLLGIAGFASRKTRA